MKKTLPLASFSSGKRDPKTKRQGSWTRVSFLALLVLLMIAATEAALSCSSDADCRRNVCIFSNCAPRPASGGTCQANSHCVKFPSTESCINSKCVSKPALEGTCEESADCATSEAICQGNKCLMPDGKTCSANSQCVSPSVCIKNLCASKSPTGGDCDEVADCATAGDTCTSNKCAEPLDPSLMVWDGTKAPVNSGFTSSPSVAVGKVLYVFEGYTGSSLMTVEAYDTMLKTWSSKTGPNIASYLFNVVAVGTNVFLIGGYNNNAGFLKTVYSYNTVSNQWDTTWAQLPEAKFSAAVAAVGNTVFVFGGQTGSGRSDLIHSLDVSSQSNSWAQPAKLPVAASQLSAAVINTDIYLLGGVIPAGGGSITNAVLKYDSQNPTANPVANAQSMIERRVEHESFLDATNKRLYALGGTTNAQNAVEFLDLNNPTGPWASANSYNPYTLKSYSGGLIGSLFHVVTNNVIQILDISVPNSLKWLPFANMPNPSATVYYTTGLNKITATATTSGSTPSFYDTSSNVWTTGSASFPIPRADSSTSTVVNGEVYVMGGEGGKSTITDVLALNTAGNAWITKTQMLAGRVGGCAAADGTDIYLYGGASGIGGAPTNSLYLMETTKSSGSGLWTLITPAGSTPIAVANCAAVVVGQKLLIFGGGTAVNGASPIGKVQSFDIPTKSWDPPFPASADITPRSYLSAVFLKGFVFVIGGSANGGGNPTPLAKVEVFDVNTKIVTAIKDMPTPRHSLGSVTDGTSIFSVGGRSAGGVAFASVEKLHTP